MPWRGLVAAVGLTLLMTLGTVGRTDAVAQNQLSLATLSCRGPNRNTAACNRLAKAFFLGFLGIGLPVAISVWTRNRGSGRRRLSQLYPPVTPGPESHRVLGWVVVGRTRRRSRAALIADHSHLHVAAAAASRLGLPSLSVPFSDVSATPGRFAWMVLASDVIRLTFARDPNIPVLVWPDAFAKLAAASEGRLPTAATAPTLVNDDLRS